MKGGSKELPFIEFFLFTLKSLIKMTIILKGGGKIENIITIRSFGSRCLEVFISEEEDSQVIPCENIFVIL